VRCCTQPAKAAELIQACLQAKCGRLCWPQLCLWAVAAGGAAAAHQHLGCSFLCASGQRTAQALSQYVHLRPALGQGEGQGFSHLSVEGAALQRHPRNQCHEKNNLYNEKLIWMDGRAAQAAWWEAKSWVQVQEGSGRLKAGKLVCDITRCAWKASRACRASRQEEALLTFRHSATNASGTRDRTLPPVMVTPGASRRTEPTPRTS
jgi:hypothetical protein